MGKLNENRNLGNGETKEKRTGRRINSNLVRFTRESEVGRTSSISVTRLLPKYSKENWELYYQLVIFNEDTMKWNTLVQMYYKFCISVTFFFLSLLNLDPL